MNYKNPALAVDVIVRTTPLDPTQARGIVLIHRKNPPLGCALPGGFVDEGETTRHAAVREMKEELNLDIKLTKLLGVYDEPDRDPRKHVVSIVFLADAKPGEMPVAGDDAKEAFIWYPGQELPNMVCDHAKIIRDFLDDISSL